MYSHLWLYIIVKKPNLLIIANGSHHCSPNFVIGGPKNSNTDF